MFAMNIPSWVVRSTTVTKNGGQVVFRDEMPGERTLSQVIDYLLRCKSDVHDIAMMELKRREGGLNGSYRF